MAYQISNGNRATSDQTFETVEAAYAAWSLNKTEIEMVAQFVGGTPVPSFKSLGQRYYIESAPAAAPAPVRAVEGPTAAQWRYLNALSMRVPSTAYAHWVKPGMSKADASRAINMLKVL
jgi:hypothetical protein